MSAVALIAVKARHLAKSRLARVLSAAERAQLAQTMMECVVAAAHEARNVDAVVIVSPQSDAVPLRSRIILDDGLGLNAALTTAILTLMRSGVREVLALAADLPDVDGADIEALLAAGRAAGGAIAPDHRGSGTNALYVKLPCAIAFGFGVNSHAVHVHSWREAGIEPAVVHRPGLAFDVDEPEDLLRLRAFRSPIRACG